MSSPQPQHKWTFTYFVPSATDIFQDLCIRFFSVFQSYILRGMTEKRTLRSCYVYTNGGDSYSEGHGVGGITSCRACGAGSGVGGERQDDCFHGPPHCLDSRRCGRVDTDGWAAALARGGGRRRSCCCSGSGERRASRAWRPTCFAGHGARNHF